MRYVDQCLARLAETNVHSIEPKPEAAIDWHRRTQTQIKKMVWSHPAVKHSYFKNADGEIHTVSPWRLNEYWSAVREPDWSQFVVRRKIQRDKGSEHANMRTVVVDGPRSIRVETRPDPALPGPDGAIVEVTAAGICGSDLHFYEADFPMPDPIALGHEAIGTVVEAGPDVRNVKVGDQVMVSSVTGCGACAGCATRDPVMCHSGFQIFGGGVLGGAQADLLAVPAADFQLLKMPEGISTEQALLLTDNLATGWAAAQRADIPFGGTVAVIGLGAVGLCALRSALFQGAATVFAVDRVDGRLERAAQWGATPVKAPAVEAILAATGGRGADAVIDAVATDASLTDALNAVRPGRHRLGCRCARYESVPAQRPGLPDSQHHAANDHRAGAAHLAGIDPTAAVRPARCRRHLHHHTAVGRSGQRLRDRGVAIRRRREDSADSP